MAYRKIDQRLWTSNTFRSMSEDARTMYQYILTCPHNNALCCYVLPILYAAHDLQWEPDRAKTAMAELVGTVRPDGTPMVLRDEATDITMAYGQLEKEGLVNPNAVKAATTALSSLPARSTVYPELLNSCIRIQESHKQKGKDILQPLINQIRKQLPEQLQEQLQEPRAHVQEQEQEQEQEGRGPAQLEIEPSPPPVITIPLNDGSEHPVTQEDLAEYRSLYGKIDVLQTLKKIRGHWGALPRNQRKTARGIKKSINTWLAKDNDRAPARASPFANLSPKGQRTAENMQRVLARMESSEQG